MWMRLVGPAAPVHLNFACSSRLYPRQNTVSSHQAIVSLSRLRLPNTNSAAPRVLGTPVQTIPHGWSISAGRRISESGTTLAVLVEEMNPMARHWTATPIVVAGGIHL